MDEQLAMIYGTGQEIEETDLEKTAAAELLVKLAEEQGVDLNDFSDEEVGEMLNDLYSGGVEHTAAAAAQPQQPEVDQEAQEKFAEADYLGRIMAHSMVQELNSIEKEAGKMGDMASKVKGVAGKVWGGAKGAARETKEAVTGWSSAGRSGGKMKLTGKERWERGKPAAKLVAGLTALETARRVGKSQGGKQKAAEADASALEQLAQQRAFEMAKEAGYIDEQGNFLVEMAPPQEKQASALDLAVERRALEICEGEGIPVEWNE